MILTPAGDGTIRRQIDRGAGNPSLASSVKSAEITAAGTLRTRLRNDDPNWGPMNGLAFDVVQTIEGDRVRTLASKGSDGKDCIKDGVVVATDTPSPWTYKCPD